MVAEAGDLEQPGQPSSGLTDRDRSGDPIQVLERSLGSSTTVARLLEIFEHRSVSPDHLHLSGSAGRDRRTPIDRWWRCRARLETPLRQVVVGEFGDSGTTKPHDGQHTELELERSRKLLSGAVDAMNRNDYLRAIRRAFYACQLLGLDLE